MKQKKSSRFRSFLRQTKAKKHILSAIIVLMLVLSLMFSSTLLFDRSLFVGAGATDWTHETNLTDPTQRVLRIDFSSNNEWLAGGCSDNHFYVYNVSTWSLAQDIDGSDNNVQCVRFSNNSQYLAWGTSGDKLHINATSDWSSVVTLTNASNTVKSVDWSGNNNWIAHTSVDTNGRVYIHNVTDSFSWETTFTETGQAIDVVFSPNSTYVAWGGSAGEIRINETGGSWSSVTQLTEATLQINDIAWSQDGNWIAYGGEDNHVFIHDISDNWANETYLPDDADIKQLAFSFNNDYLAVTNADGECKIYNVSDWSLARTFEVYDTGNAAHGVDFSNDNNWMAFSDADDTTGAIYVWNMGEGASSVYSISGLDGNDRITFSGNNNSVIWSNESYPGGHIAISSNVNSSDSVSEIHIDIGGNIDAQINADNLSIEINVANGSNWTGDVHQIATDGENITLNSSVWVTSNWCHGVDPFPITDETVVMYVRFKLTLGGVSGGTYTMDNCEVAWKITYTP